MNDVFFQDPWWLIVIKVLALFVILLLWTIFNAGMSGAWSARCSTVSAPS